MADHSIEHPRLSLALHTRTKLWGTLNLAVALRGRSTGWGDGTPRRTFVGHNRRTPYHRGFELVLVSGPPEYRTRTLFKVRTGSGLANPAKTMSNREVR
jgi:hypothetical protein